MIPPGVPEELRQRLLPPEIVVPPAVFLASEAGRGLTGRRLVATEWSPEHPEDILLRAASAANRGAPAVATLVDEKPIVGIKTTGSGREEEAMPA